MAESRITPLKPKFLPYLTEVPMENWQEERYLAIAETDLPDGQFPDSFPFTITEMLSPDFWPLSQQIGQRALINNKQS